MNADIERIGSDCRGEGPPELPQDAVQALDVALKHGTLLNPMCTAVNHGFFFYDPRTTHTLGNGAEVGLCKIALTPSPARLEMW